MIKEGDDFDSKIGFLYDSAEKMREYEYEDYDKDASYSPPQQTP